MRLFHNISKPQCNLDHLTAKGFATSSDCRYLLSPLKEWKAVFTSFSHLCCHYDPVWLLPAVGSPASSVLYQLCFVWCAIPLKIVTSEISSELWRKHSKFFHILQNNGNLYAKIKYPTLHGKKVKFSYFSLYMRLFTKKINRQPHVKQN